MNREGICSTVGYFSIFSLAAGFSKLAIRGKNEFTQLVNLAKTTAITAFIFLLHETFIGGTSRRLANVGYVLWMCSMCSYCWLIITICCLRLPKVPKLLSSLNRHQFYVFLLANVITGAINMKIDTLKVDAVTSYVIMVLYLLIL